MIELFDKLDFKAKSILLTIILWSFKIKQKEATSGFKQ